MRTSATITTHNILLPPPGPPRPKQFFPTASKTAQSRRPPRRDTVSMPTPDEDWSAVFVSLEQLRDRWPDNNWSYDRRLKCVASSIPLAREAEARAAMS